MRILCGYSGDDLHKETKTALVKQAVEYVDMSGDDFAYWHNICERWTGEDDLLIIEQDTTPTPRKKWKSCRGHHRKGGRILKVGGRVTARTSGEHGQAESAHPLSARSSALCALVRCLRKRSKLKYNAWSLDPCCVPAPNILFHLPGRWAITATFALVRDPCPARVR